MIDGFELVHLSPGRLRFKVLAFKRDRELTRRVTARLAGVPGVATAKANPLTGSLLLEYDAERLRTGESGKAFTHALQELFPQSLAKGRLVFELRWLSGRDNVARRLEQTLSRAAGVERVDADANRGHIAIHYDPAVELSDLFVRLLQRVSEDHWL